MPETPQTQPIKVAYRRGPMLLALLCNLLALPILIANSVGHVGAFWVALSLVLLGVGLFIVRREGKRVRESSQHK